MRYIYPRVSIDVHKRSFIPIFPVSNTLLNERSRTADGHDIQNRTSHRPRGRLIGLRENPPTRLRRRRMKSSCAPRASMCSCMNRTTGYALRRTARSPGALGQSSDKGDQGSGSAKRPHFPSLPDSIDTSTSQGTFSLQVLGAIAQLERAQISGGNKEGEHRASEMSVRAFQCIRVCHSITRWSGRPRSYPSQCVAAASHLLAQVPSTSDQD